MVFQYLNSIKTNLLPIDEYVWKNWHAWPYQEIGKEIRTDIVLDAGCGCGLLGTFLVYHGFCGYAILVDNREPQITFAKDLIETLGLQDRIKIVKNRLSKVPLDMTLVSTRFGSLIEFEKIVGDGRAVTLRRTSECEPFFKRESTLNWNKKIVRRLDGFELELLSI